MRRGASSCVYLPLPSRSTTLSPSSSYCARETQNSSRSFIMSLSTLPPMKTMNLRRGGSSIRSLKRFIRRASPRATSSKYLRRKGRERERESLCVGGGGVSLCGHGLMVMIVSEQHSNNALALTVRGYLAPDGRGGRGTLWCRRRGQCAGRNQHGDQPLRPESYQTPCSPFLVSHCRQRRG